jgi:hypothetical protein
MHTALDALYTAGPNIEANLELAKAVFLDEYRKEFDSYTDELYFPKTPSMAFEALEDYLRVMERERGVWKPLYTEISLSVPILYGLILNGRMDQLSENIETGEKKVREYKTTGRYDRQWRDQWLLSTQIGTYTHALYSLYPEEEVHGVVVEAFIFQKKGVQFQQLPCRRTPAQLLTWLQSTSNWALKLADELRILENYTKEELEDMDVLSCFNLNPQSCTKYFGCPYHDFCSAWSNPIQEMYEPPIGFREEFWDPSEKPAKKEIRI